MIFLFTDFGAGGPYIGQMQAVIRLAAPGVDIIDLVSNAPSGDPESSAYLLAALVSVLPERAVVLGVVDPGVGGERAPVVLEADGRWFVGPDNGLFYSVAKAATECRWHRIDWCPERLSASFHGRDLFAPIAARIARGDSSWPRRARSAPDLGDWPADVDRVIYFDTYGNAFTGRRYDPAFDGRSVRVGRHSLPQGRTFSSLPRGQGFWYRNSIDLIELAVNQGSAHEEFDLRIGTPVRFEG